MELKTKIYDQCFEGSANKIFKEFLKENILFRYNWNLHYERHEVNYTLFAFLRDCKILKRQNRFLEGIIYDVEDFLNMVIEIHMGSDLDSDSDDLSTDDQSSGGSDIGGGSDGEDW